MQEGDKVDILDILEDNSSVIIRTQDDRVGYYNLDYLASADEVFARPTYMPWPKLSGVTNDPSFRSLSHRQLTTSFAQEEQQRRAEQEAREREEQRRREQEYEEQLREQMKRKAQEDRERRALEAEMRKREQEELERQVSVAVVALARMVFGAFTVNATLRFFSSSSSCAACGNEAQTRRGPQAGRG